jgi:hypothetical protein
MLAGAQQQKGGDMPPGGKPCLWQSSSVSGHADRRRETAPELVLAKMGLVLSGQHHHRDETTRPDWLCFELMSQEREKEACTERIASIRT